MFKMPSDSFFFFSFFFEIAPLFMRLASTLVEVKFNNQVAYKVFFAFVLIYELPITMIALTFEEFSTLSF